jgi:OmpA-OmpF porin, OOP family
VVSVTVGWEIEERKRIESLLGFRTEICRLAPREVCMASIMDTLRDGVSREVLSAVSRQTGESEASIANGFAAAISTIAATVANGCDRAGFMTYVAVLSARTAADPESLTAIPAEQWLPTLVGSNLFAVTGRIASVTGLHESTVASLLPVSARLVLGGLGRLMREDDLTAAGLAARLSEERAQLASARAAGSEVPEPAQTPVTTTRTVIDRPAGRRRSSRHRAPVASGWSALMLVLLAAGVGGLIGWVAHEPVEQAPLRVGEPATNAVGTTGTNSGRFTRALPGNEIITILSGTAEDRLSSYLASARHAETTIDLDRIAYQNGSAVLTPESRDQIDTIATILRAYPTTSVTAAGYADDQGTEDENLQLSRARAEAVATRLVAAGVSADRVRAEGHGRQNPSAGSVTEDGRSGTTRIALEVTVR